MNIFGIGPLEIAFILILVIIIFGPNDIVKTGRTIGRSLNKLVRSDTWKVINRTSQELKNLPNRLMQEAGVDEIKEMAKVDLSATEHSILPPASSALPEGKSDTPGKTMEVPSEPSPDVSPPPEEAQHKPVKPARTAAKDGKE
jgi:Sec-independent protein translocase protein TatA